MQNRLKYITSTFLHLSASRQWSTVLQHLRFTLCSTNRAINDGEGVFEPQRGPSAACVVSAEVWMVGFEVDPACDCAVNLA